MEIFIGLVVLALIAWAIVYNNKNKSAAYPASTSSAVVRQTKINQGQVQTDE